MTPDLTHALLTLAAGVAAFIAGWRAHRWHILSFSRWPRRTTLKSSTRRAGPFSIPARRR